MRHEPNLKTPPEKALYCPEEGAVEPVIAARCMLDAVIGGGGRIVPNSGGCSLLFDDDEVIGVQTRSGGQFEADDVVVAAGAGTADLLAPLGVRLANTSPAGLLAHSAIAPAGLLNGILLGPDCHVRQTREGRLVVGASFAGNDPGERADEVSRDLMSRARLMIANADSLDVAFFTIGHRPTPADGYPAIGRLDAINGVYVAMMHSGVTLAPIVGQLVAKEIVQGDRDDDLDPFDPNRPSLN